MAEWIAIAVTILAGIIAWATTWGKLGSRMDNVEADILGLKGQSKEHYTHSADTEAHWTERERNALDKKLDNIHEEILASRKANHDTWNEVMKRLGANQ